MIGRIHAGGGNFGGLIAYLTHDAGTEADPRPDTDERVGFTEVENLVPCSGKVAARFMAATVRDADALKQLAGVRPSGRRLQKPVYHFSLSWAPDEKPTQTEMLIAAQGSLRFLGMGDRQAVVIEHRDRPHPHVHVVVNRVSPEDGRAASTSHDARTLSAWARQWELEHGELRCRRRTDRDPSDPPAERRRCPGRRNRSAAERRQWAELYQRHRAEQVADDGSEGQELPRRHALERVTLARKLERERGLDAAERVPAQDEDSAAKLDRQPASAEQPAAADDQQHRPDDQQPADDQHRPGDQHRQVALERQRADAAAREEEAQREAAARKRRWEALASFPGAQDAARKQFDQREPGRQEQDQVSIDVFDGVLAAVEGAVDKSLAKQEADLRTRLQEWDDRGQDLLMRARISVLGSGQAQPADRQERAQVLDAADRLDIAERTVWGVKSRLEESMKITPSHLSIQAAARKIAQNSRKPWERDIADAIAAGNIHLGADDPGPEGETKQIRAKLRTIAQSDASGAADREHAEAVKAWEQVPSWRRWAIAKPERPQPKEPDPPKPEDIERYREDVVFRAAGIIHGVFRHYQPQLDPESRSGIFQNEMRSQLQSRQQPEQKRGLDHGGRSR